MELDASAKAEWIVHDNFERRRFEIELGDSVAIAEYTLPKGMIMFTHTEVPPEHGGTGIGKALIRAGLEAARQRELQVIPFCPFFAAYFKKHDENQDLLAGTWRRPLGISFLRILLRPASSSPSLTPFVHPIPFSPLHP